MDGLTDSHTPRKPKETTAAPASLDEIQNLRKEVREKITELG